MGTGPEHEQPPGSWQPPNEPWGQQQPDGGAQWGQQQPPQDPQWGQQPWGSPPPDAAPQWGQQPDWQQQQQPPQQDWQQQPYGGPAQPYGFGPQPPPPPKKSNTGMIIGIVGGALVVVILLVVGVTMLSGSGDDPKKTSGKTAAEAGRELSQARGASYTGTLGSSQATFSVTKSGSVRGSFTSEGSPVSMLKVGGQNYLKAGSSYWTANGQNSTDADKADGKWTLSDGPDFKPDQVLDPTKIAQTLQRLGNDPLAKKAVVNGTKVIRVNSGATVYYITQSKPHKVIRVEGNSGGTAYALNLTPLTPGTIGPVFDQLRGDVKNLQDAYDPDLSVTQTGKPDLNCSSSGCTVHETVRVSATDSGTFTVQIKMTAKFSGVSGGTAFDTCTDSGTTKPGSTLTFSCRSEGSAWRSFYNSKVGRFTVYARPSHEYTINSSSDVNQLVSKLNQEQQGG